MIEDVDTFILRRTNKIRYYVVYYVEVYLELN